MNSLLVFGSVQWSPGENIKRKLDFERRRMFAIHAQEFINRIFIWKHLHCKLHELMRYKTYYYSINGVTGDAAIANLWKESFAKLYSMHNNSDLLNVMLECNNDDEAHVITCTDVVKTVEKMKCRKACGQDGISTEAIKFGGHLLTVHLTLLFNLFLSHCYMPSDLLKTTVVPTLKNKMGDISDINNYRAIALSNSISKLLETIIFKLFSITWYVRGYISIWIQEKSFHLFRLLNSVKNYWLL